jgi:hypothetical protein
MTIIKTDFVTNSSSTAYIVFIPTKYYPSRHDLMEAFDNIKDNWMDDELTTEELDKLFDEVSEVIEYLKEGNEAIGFYDGYADDCTRETWHSCLELCERKGFVVGSVEIPSDGCSILQGIKEENIMGVLADCIDLPDVFKDFIKEEKR